MNVFDLAAKISLDTSAYTSGLSAAKDALGKVGKATKVFAEVSMAAIGAATTAVGGFAKSALNSYASYEQLVGGVDTLFKDSSKKVQEYANNAYKTAGLSANEYMETVTSFSASLLQSLDGDTAKAADIADMAIRDMSDNANKMGTSMESIQNAYQGFAKQNYTMLDNLKLGYGGTKSEMERLLKTANELNAKQGKYTDYQIENYSDIVEAINVVQQEMGITGTTAEEAAATIEGSTKSMKASWENLKVAIATGNEETISTSIDSLAKGLGDMANNIIPRLETIIGGIGQAVEKVGPMLAKAVPKAVERLLPLLVSAGVSLTKTIGKVIVNLAPTLAAMIKKLFISAANSVKNNAGTVLKSVTNVIQKVVDLFVENMPEFIQLGLEALLAIANGISDNLPSLITSVTRVITFLADQLTANLSVILDAAIGILRALGRGLVDNLPQLVEAAMQLVEALASYLMDALPELVPAAVGVVLKLVEILTNADNIGRLVGAAVDIVLALVEGILNSLPLIVEAAPKIITNLVDGLTNAESINKLMAGAAEVVSKLVMYILDPRNLLKVVTAGTKISLAIASGILSAVLKVHEAINEILVECGKTIKGYFDTAYDWGKQLIKKIVEGMKSVLDDVKDVASSVGGFFSGGAKKAWSGVTSLFHAEGGITAHASGGLMLNRPVLTTSGDLFGEAGREAILPIDTNTGWMDEIAEKISRRSGGIIIQELNINMEGMEISSDYGTDRFVERINEQLQLLMARENAAVGGANW